MKKTIFMLLLLTLSLVSLSAFADDDMSDDASTISPMDQSADSESEAVEPIATDEDFSEE